MGSGKTFLDENDEDVLEFLTITADIAGNEEYQKLKHFIHHHSTTRYQHCLNVAWYTYYWTKKLGLNYRSAARGAMLHDFYLYEGHIPPKGSKMRHSELHPRIALENTRKYFKTDPVMEDVIVHHMWPNAKDRPLTKEGYIITIADKYCASIELLGKPLYTKQVLQLILTAPR